MSLYELLGTVEIGLVFGLVALGAYLSFQILAFPDLTVEGSFPLGAAVAAVLIVNFGVNPWPATLAGALAGFGAGYITALMNVRFNIMHILAGILVSISLYSVNLRIMGGPNKPLLGTSTIFSELKGFGLPTYMISPILILIVVVLIKFALDLFLHTGVGLAMRAAGANPGANLLSQGGGAQGANGPGQPAPQDNSPAQVTVTPRQIAVTTENIILEFDIAASRPLNYVVITLRSAQYQDTRQALMTTPQGRVPFLVPVTSATGAFTYELKDEAGAVLASGAGDFRRLSR